MTRAAGMGPSPLTKAPEPEEVDRPRSLWCPAYGNCLRLALRGGLAQLDLRALRPPVGAPLTGCVEVLFDSGTFAGEFGFAGTPYPDGIRATAASFRNGGQGSGTRR